MNSQCKIQISTQMISNKPLCSSSRCTYYIFISTALFLKELMSLTQALHSSLLTVSTFSSMHATCYLLLCVSIPIELFQHFVSFVSLSILFFLLFQRIHFGHCIQILINFLYSKSLCFNLI